MRCRTRLGDHPRKGLLDRQKVRLGYGLEEGVAIVLVVSTYGSGRSVPSSSSTRALIGSAAGAGAEPDPDSPGPTGRVPLPHYDALALFWRSRRLLRRLALAA